MQSWQTHGRKIKQHYPIMWLVNNLLRLTSPHITPEGSKITIDIIYIDQSRSLDFSDNTGKNAFFWIGHRWKRRSYHIESGARYTHVHDHLGFIRQRKPTARVCHLLAVWVGDSDSNVYHLHNVSLSACWHAAVSNTNDEILGLASGNDIINQENQVSHLH